MSAFNTLLANTICPRCGTAQDFEIQFKYGDTWQHSYVVGNKLRWGGNDIGSPSVSHVTVEGIGGPCSNCHEPYLDFEVIIENDIITGVHPLPRGS